MRSIRYISLLFVVMAGLACTSERVTGVGDGMPLISVSPSVSVTKAMIEGNDINSDGTSIILYDEQLSSKYIDGKTVVYDENESDWILDGGRAYPWTKTADHNFYGWLQYDGKSGIGTSDIFGSLSLDANHHVSIPETQLTLTSSQFDFCYSDMVTRTVSSANYSTVDIPLSHLFTSFGIKAHNYTPQEVTVSQVTLYGLVNKKSATIIFTLPDSGTAGSSSAVYTPASSGSRMSATTLMASPVIIPANSAVDNLITSGGKASSAKDAFYLMWPQTKAELAASNPVSTSTDACIVVAYSMGGASHTATLAIPQGQGWNAGECHQIELSFIDKKIVLTVSPAPWRYSAPEIDYDSEIVVNEAGKFKILSSTATIVEKVEPDENGVEELHRYVYSKGGNPIIGTFTIESPKDATWMVGKNGDIDWFEIDNASINPDTGMQYGSPGDGIQYNYGTIDGSEARISIYPAGTDPDEDRQMRLNFTVRLSSGETMLVTDDVMPAKVDGRKVVYIFVLQAS